MKSGRRAFAFVTNLIEVAEFSCYLKPIMDRWKKKHGLNRDRISGVSNNTNPYITTKPEASPSATKGVAIKRGWWEIVNSHFRRVSLEILNIFMNHDWLFWLIGVVNKRLGLIESIFLAYPATENYALAYLYRHRLSKVLWNPWPCGLLLQNKKIGLMFCISATNAHFTDPKNLENLRQVAERMEKLRRLLGANRKTFAGILPGVLYCKKIIHEAPEADLAAKAVVQAVNVVQANESLDSETPVIVLGGRGFIGRRVIKLLNKPTTYSIDTVAGQSEKDWPNHLRGRRVIVVNTSLSHALDNYLEVLWPGTVVINEVYPEPTPRILEKLRTRNCSFYHIVGVNATAVPPFPAAYKGAIPCCAAWPSPHIKILVRRAISRDQ